jgi:hypothetical protein
MNQLKPEIEATLAHFVRGAFPERRGVEAPPAPASAAVAANVPVVEPVAQPKLQVFFTGNDQPPSGYCAGYWKNRFCNRSGCEYDHFLPEEHERWVRDASMTTPGTPSEPQETFTSNDPAPSGYCYCFWKNNYCPRVGCGFSHFSPAEHSQWISENKSAAANNSCDSQRQHQEAPQSEGISGDLPPRGYCIGYWKNRFCRRSGCEYEHFLPEEHAQWLRDQQTPAAAAPSEPHRPQLVQDVKSHGSSEDRDNGRSPMRQSYCIDFLKGNCTRGNNCRYIHEHSAQRSASYNSDSPRRQSPRRSFSNRSSSEGHHYTTRFHNNNYDPTFFGAEHNYREFNNHRPCADFQKGHCSFGQRCRYIHNEREYSRSYKE